MGIREITEAVKAAQKELEDLANGLQLPHKKDRLLDLERMQQEPDFWDEATRAQTLSKERDELKRVVDIFSAQENLVADIFALLELTQESGDEEFLQEAESQLKILQQAIEDLQLERMLSGEHDHSDAILTINAGAGGTEACDWAGILLRMYTRWAEQRGYACELIDFTEGDGAGYKSATLTINGPNAYGYLKAENGVHRLVRISPFDANKRRHTSFSSVHAMPALKDDIKIDIKPDDIRLETFRAGGAGGQHVNKTDSAVRLIHTPTNTIVTCRSGRSQHQNREVAMNMLKAKLYEQEMEKQRALQENIAGEKKRVEWGSQIRSYVLQPYQMVKDHRTDFETAQVDKVLDGDLDGFMKSFLLQESMG